MTPADVADFLALVDSFVTGVDQSKMIAQEIEGLVLECFSDRPWFDEVSLALAQFAPGGGSHFYDEVALAYELKRAAATLQAERLAP